MTQQSKLSQNQANQSPNIWQVVGTQIMKGSSANPKWLKSINWSQKKNISGAHSLINQVNKDNKKY